MIWTDEKSFELYPQENKFKLRLLEGENPEDFPKPKVQQGGGKIMFWGAITGFGQIFLDEIKGKITSKTYCNFLENKALPVIKRLCSPSALFQQDNAKSHASGETQAFLEKNNVKLLDWPPQSPDINPIEQVWGWLAHRLNGMRIQNIKELRGTVLKLWEEIPKEAILAFIEKIPDKILYIKEHGGEVYSDHKDRE